jgi:hypothetical protein
MAFGSVTDILRSVVTIILRIRDDLLLLWCPPVLATMVFPSIASSMALTTISEKAPKRNSIEAKYEKHRRHQQELQRLYLFVIMTLVALSMLGLYYFGGATKETQQKLHSLHGSRMHQLRNQKNHPLLGETSTDGDGGHNNPLQLLDPPNDVATNRIRVNQEVKNKVLDDNMAAKIEELKKFQEGFVEAKHEFANNVPEQLENAEHNRAT